MRKWSLDQLSVIGATPAEYVEIAACAGYDAVSPLMGIEDNWPLPVVPFSTDDPKTAGMVQSLKGTGLKLNEADGFVITPEFDRAGMRQGLELIAVLGANNAVSLVFDDEPNRAFENLAWLCDEANDAGVGVVVEFTVLSEIPSLRAARGLIDKIGPDKLAMRVDLMHLAQANETPADMLALPEGMIRGAQLSDAPANLDIENYARIAMGERMAPGDGELPVNAFLAAVPDSVTVGLEIPFKNPGDLREHAKMLLERAKSLETD